MMQPKARHPIPASRSFAGGPFYLVLRRLGLLGADRLTTLRCATFLALLAWLPPALLAVVQSLADGSDRGWSYFTDLTVPARYLIAIWAMVAGKVSRQNGRSNAHGPAGHYSLLRNRAAKNASM